MQPSFTRQKRQSLRLKNFDYSQAGTYFITICLNHKECLFGEIVQGAMLLNPAGEMISALWQAQTLQFPSIRLDAYVVMPNHIHGIISTVGATLVVAQPASVAPAKVPSIADIVGAFKSRSTLEYIRGVRALNWRAFNGRLWQRNYYEHVIRNEASMTSIREYIVNNPLQWQFDKENPYRV
ncbi:MAG TPA: transposase [Cellvibrionaceae bacterium]|nr:transposase [Cellvibrionaceae bacterium]